MNNFQQQNVNNPSQIRSSILNSHLQNTYPINTQNDNINKNSFNILSNNPNHNQPQHHKRWSQSNVNQLGSFVKNSLGFKANTFNQINSLTQINQNQVNQKPKPTHSNIINSFSQIDQPQQNQHYTINPQNTQQIIYDDNIKSQQIYDPNQIQQQQQNNISYEQIDQNHIQNITHNQSQNIGHNQSQNIGHNQSQNNSIHLNGVSQNQSKYQIDEYCIYNQDNSCYSDILLYFKQRVPVSFYVVLLVLIVYMIIDGVVLWPILRDLSNKIMINNQSLEKGFWYYFFTVMSTIGKQGMIVIMVICLYCFPNKQNKLWTMMVYISINFGISNLLKYLYSDTRPYYNTVIYPKECDFGFGRPSGHSYLSTLILFIIYYEYLYKKDENYYREIVKPLNNNLQTSYYNDQSQNSYKKENLIAASHNYIVLVLLILVDLSICISRIYLGVHDLGQVILGVVIGLCLLGLYILGFRCLLFETICYLDSIKWQQYESQEQKDLVNSRRTKLITKYCRLIIVIIIVLTVMFILTDIDKFEFDLNLVQFKCRHRKIEDLYFLKMNGFYAKAYIYTSFFNIGPLIMIGVILRSWINDYLKHPYELVIENHTRNILMIILMFSILVLIVGVVLLILGVPFYFVYLTKSIKISGICKFIYYNIAFILGLLSYFTWFQILVQGKFDDEFYLEIPTGKLIEYLKNRLESWKVKANSNMYFGYQYIENRFYSQQDLDIDGSRKNSYYIRSDNQSFQHEHFDDHNHSNVNRKQKSWMVSSGQKQQQK